MFGFLKKFTRKSEPAPAPKVPAAVANHVPSVATRSSTPAAALSAKNGTGSPTPFIQNGASSNGATTTVESAPARAPVSVPPPAPAPMVFSTETVDLPLKQLWSKLSPEVVKYAASQPAR